MSSSVVVEIGAVKATNNVQLKGTVKVANDIQLRVSGLNLLASISSHPQNRLIALPDHSKLRVRRWPLNEVETPTMIELDEDVSPPIFLEWGSSDVCPSFLAVAGPKALQVFQIDGNKKGQPSVLTLARFLTPNRPVGLSWHPRRCVLAVLDKDQASHLDLSSPSKGAVLVNSTKFTVAGALKCGAWAKKMKSIGSSPRAGTSADKLSSSSSSEEEDAVGILALAGASELNLFSFKGGQGVASGGGNSKKETTATTQMNRCLGGDHRGAREIGQFRAIAPLEPCGSLLQVMPSSHRGGEGVDQLVVLFVATLDTEVMLKAIGEGLSSLLSSLPGGASTSSSVGGSSSNGGERRSLNDVFSHTSGFRRTLPDDEAKKKKKKNTITAASEADAGETSVSSIGLIPDPSPVVDLRGRIGNETTEQGGSALFPFGSLRVLPSSLPDEDNRVRHPEGEGEETAKKTKSNKNTLQAKEGSRVSVFALAQGSSSSAAHHETQSQAQRRLRVVASFTLPNEIQSPDLLAVLAPPTDKHCGLFAVGSHTSRTVVLLSVAPKNTQGQRQAPSVGATTAATTGDNDLLQLSLLQTIHLPASVFAKGLSIETIAPSSSSKKEEGCPSRARLVVLCARRSDFSADSKERGSGGGGGGGGGGGSSSGGRGGRKAPEGTCAAFTLTTAMPTSLKSTPTMSYDTEAKIYECSIPLAKHFSPPGKSTVPQQQQQQQQENVDTDVRSQIKAKFMSMMLEDGNESDDDTDSSIPSEISRHEVSSSRVASFPSRDDALPSLVSVTSTASSSHENCERRQPEHEKSTAHSKNQTSTATLSAVSSENRSCERIGSGSGGGGGGDNAATAAAMSAASLTALAVAIGAMEQKLTSKLEQVLEVSEQNSRRIASLEARVIAAGPIGGATPSPSELPQPPLPQPSFQPSGYQTAAHAGLWVPAYYAVTPQQTPNPPDPTAPNPVLSESRT